MLYHAAKAGAMNLKLAVEETLTSFRRAGLSNFLVNNIG
jgi:delta-aminolevulinic acid dehydratase/porphobilinogen synthase